MDRAGNRHNRLAVLNQFLQFGWVFYSPRVGKFRIDPPQLFKVSDILGRGDEGHDQRPAKRGFTDFLNYDTIAGCVQLLEIACDHRPIRDALVIRRLEPKYRLRRRYLSYRGQGKETK